MRDIHADMAFGRLTPNYWRWRFVCNKCRAVSFDTFLAYHNPKQISCACGGAGLPALSRTMMPSAVIFTGSLQPSR